MKCIFDESCPNEGWIAFKYNEDMMLCPMHCTMAELYFEEHYQLVDNDDGGEGDDY